MSFVVFLLIYAAAAIALLAVVWFLLRDLRRKRLGTSRPARTRDTSEREPSKLKLPSWRQAPAPEPQPETPPPPRRRQLQSFAEAEKAETGANVAEAEIDANVAHAHVDADAADAVVDKEAGDTHLGANAADAEAEAHYDYAQAVLERLENVFDRLQAGDITLEEYRAELLAEQAAIEARIADLGPDGEGDDMAAALAARESARWCLDWADEQARPD